MGTGELAAREVDGAVRFSVRVTPRASRAAITGVHAGALKVSLTAPPVEGAANAALIELLADALGVAKRAVRIEHGDHGRGTHPFGRRVDAHGGAGDQECRDVRDHDDLAGRPRYVTARLVR